LVAPGSSGGLFDLTEILPGQLGSASEHLTREDFFDGETFFWVFSIVKSADPTIRGQTGIGGNACPSNEE